MTVMTRQQRDGLPFCRLPARIDSHGFRFQLCQEIVIARDFRAAGRADLHEREFLAIRRPLLQESFHAAQPFEQALGIVHAIYAHSDEVRLDAQLIEQLAAQHVWRYTWLQASLRFAKIHADGKRLHEGNMSAALHREAFPFNLRFQSSVYRLQEIIAMRLYLE